MWLDIKKLSFSSPNVIPEVLLQQTDGACLVSQMLAMRRRQEPLSAVVQFPYVREQSLRMNNGYNTSNDSGWHYNKWSQQQKRSKSMLLIM